MPLLARFALQVERLASPLLERLPQGLVTFLSVGVGGLCVDIAVLTLLEAAGVYKAWARLASIGVATLFTWLLNRRFTFGESGRRSGAELGRYCLVAAIAQSINYLIFLGVSDLLPHLPHPLVAVIGAVAAATFSYTGQRFFTFSRDTAEVDA